MVSRLACSLLVLAWLAGAAVARPRWQTLPLPPAMPPPAKAGHVEVDGARIYYAVHGEGPPVVLLHGGMGNGDHFAFQLPALAKTHRTIVIDSRGQGRSTLGGGALSYRRMATDTLAVLDVLGVHRAAFVGWSDGGSIALDIAVTHPERVSRLVVLGTNFDASGSKPRRGKRPAATFDAYTTKCRKDHVRMGGTVRSFRASITALLPAWRSVDGLTKEQVRAIEAPTLVGLGDHDEIIHLEHARDMAALLPAGQFVLFPGSSHFALWQDPARVTRALTAFLGSE